MNETMGDWHGDAPKPDAQADDRRSIDAASDAPPEDARTDEAAWLWAVTDEPDEGVLWNEKTTLRHDEASASH